ncbi:MAG TPA: M28 family metallopeptidase [Thermoanaerobaculia bacterium]
MRHLQTLFLITICPLLLAPPTFPQEPTPEAERAMAGIRPHAIRAHMRFLADDLLEGRGTGTRGHELAAKYVASAFEGMGLEPAGTGGSYFQPVPMLRMTMVDSESVLSFTRDGQTTTLQYGTDYVNDFLFEQETSLTAPVVFAGYGVTAPELQRDDYAGIDARGKIVVLLLGSPPTFSAHQKAYYSDRRVRAGNALAHGAVGLLYIRTPEFDKRLPWKMAVARAKSPFLSWTDEAGKPRFRPELRGRAQLSGEGAAKLFAGAPHSLAEVLEAAAAGRSLSFELPVQASFRTVSRRERTESPNVAAVLRGSDPKLRDEYIVVSAHLDHVGVGEPVNGDSIYNGAYDNASGIAALLEMAKAFTRLPAPPRRSVLFLAVTAEELGLQGSDYFARNPTVPIDRIVANVNMDMFLMLYPLKDVVGYGAEHSSLGPALEKAAGRLGVTVSPDPIPDEVFFIRSDQYSFIQRGIPAVSLASGQQTTDPAIDTAAVSTQWRREKYHQPGDDMSQPIDFDSGARFAQLNFLLTWMTAQDDKAPSWNPGDFFGEKFARQAGTAGDGQ